LRTQPSLDQLRFLKTTFGLVEDEKDELEPRRTC
jgi:hypothetical protein